MGLDSRNEYRQIHVMLGRISILFALLMMASCSVPYQISYQSPTRSIIIQSNKIFVTEIEYTYDNPVSATPSGSKRIEKEGPIDNKEMRDLHQLIMNNGFLKLEDSGAPATERNYPTSIQISSNQINKKVTHRSNPSYPAAPEPFNEIEKMLAELAKKAR